MDYFNTTYSRTVKRIGFMTSNTQSPQQDFVSFLQIQQVLDFMKFYGPSQIEVFQSLERKINEQPELNYKATRQ